MREMASLVFAIGKAHPRRRKRYRAIKANHPELWQRMVQKGIVEDWDDAGIADEYGDPAESEAPGEDDGSWEGFEDDELPPW